MGGQTRALEIEDKYEMALLEQRVKNSRRQAAKAYNLYIRLVDNSCGVDTPEILVAYDEYIDTQQSMAKLLAQRRWKRKN